MNVPRAGIAQYTALARYELRHSVSASRALAWRAAVILCWFVVAVLAGSLVGLMAVFLPPLDAFGFVAAAGLIFLWVAPDMSLVSEKWVRRLILLATAINICIPIYYSYHGISPRRLASYPALALFALAAATSPHARQRIVDVVRGNAAISACVFGYMIVAVLSVGTAMNPLATANAVVSTSIDVYLPFLAILYVLVNEEDVFFFMNMILVCTFFISVVGMADFVLSKPVMVSFLPRSVLEELIANFPVMAKVATGGIRDGAFRASSVFNVSLSFAEYEAMIAAIAAVYGLHGRDSRERVMGAVVLVACILGICASGSRGGYVSGIVAGVLLGAAFVVRNYNYDRRSMKSPIFGSLAMIATVVVVGSIIFIPQVHVRVLGGGADQASNQGRAEQWKIGIPKIETNPITGRGYGMGAQIVGYSSPGSDFQSIDSGVLGVLVETGLLGAAGYFGAILISAGIAIRRYVMDSSWTGALMGGLGCSLAAFATYRTVLAARENQATMFILIACVMVLNFAHLQRGAPKTAPQRPRSGP